MSSLTAGRENGFGLSVSAFILRGNASKCLVTLGASLECRDPALADIAPRATEGAIVRQAIRLAASILF
jgi:hypothetical protein